MKDEYRIGQIFDAGNSGRLRKFPIDALPPKLRHMVSEVSRIRQAPLEITGPLALGALSSSLGGSILGDDLIPGWKTPANLYILSVAPTGTGKSASSILMQPVHDMETEIYNGWKDRCPALRVRKRKLEALIKGPGRHKKADDEDEEDEAGPDDEDGQMGLVEIEAELEKIKTELANEPCLVCEDTTTQELAKLLAANRETATLFSDDARDVLRNMQSDKGLYLKCYSGGRHVVGRVTRDTVRLSHPCLATVLLVQPDWLGSLFGDEAMLKSGLMPRFLTACYRGQPQPIDCNVSPINGKVQEQYNNLLRELLLRFRIGRQAPAIIPTLAEARKALVDFHNRSIQQTDQSPVNLTDFARRYAEQAARVAVNLHAALWGSDCVEHPISLATAEAAIEIVEWFAEHLAAIVADTQGGIASNTLSRIMQFIRDKEAQAAANPEIKGTTNREVYWRFKLDKDESQRFLDMLVTNGLVAPTPLKKRGQSFVLYRPTSKATRDPVTQ